MENLQWTAFCSLVMIVSGKNVNIYRPSNLNENRLNPTGCGGILHQREGTITSPGYPGKYPANAFCFWEIFVPDGDILSIEFEDFQVEDPDLETKFCMSDKLIIIHHVHGEDSPTPRYYCGDDVPQKLTYKGYKIVVGFISDGTMERGGFRAKYSVFRDPELVVKEESNGVTETSRPRNVPVYRDCGGTIAELAATIQSPGYPNSYPDHVTCVWQVRTSRDQPIFMMFDDLDLEDSDDCRHDYVDVYDGNNQHLAKFCGRHKPNVVLTSLGRMNIVFRSDGHNPEKASGFSLSYGNVLSGKQNSTIVLGNVKTGEIIEKKSFAREDL